MRPAQIAAPRFLGNFIQSSGGWHVKDFYGLCGACLFGQRGEFLVCPEHSISIWRQRADPTGELQSSLPLGLQRDLKAFFGGYKKACELSDKLLFSAGDADAVDEACRKTKVGKILPDAIYVHISAL